jgi:hypothetical protein
MPQRYELKCNENKNMREGLGGCRPVIHPVPEFKPHKKDKGGVSIIHPNPNTNPNPNPKPSPNPNLTPTPPSSVNPNLGFKNDSKVLAANVRPLQTISKLTPDKISKGKMAAAAYHLVEDYAIRGPQGNTLTKFEELGIVEKNRRAIDTGDRLSKSGVPNYRVMRDYSDRNAMVLRGSGAESGKVKIVLKGLQGLESTQQEIQHAKDTILNNKKDYRYLDELYARVIESEPNANIEVISYSNGGPKGMYLADKYNLDHYSIDPLLGKTELNALRNRTPASPALEIVRTTKPAMAMGAVQTLQEIIQSKPIPNTQITVIEPVVGAPTNPLSRLSYDHSLQTYIKPQAARENVGVMGRNLVGSAVAGVVPLALASYITDQVTPNAPSQVKLGETVIGGSALTKLISPLVGAGAAPISATLLPLAASLEAANVAGQVADVVLPDDMADIPRETIKGAFQGAVGGVGYGAGQAASSAIASTMSGGAGVTTAGELAIGGVEMAELAAPLLVAEEGVGIGAAMLSGAEVGGASTSEFGPLAVGGAALGALIGLGGALLFSGQKHTPPKESEVQKARDYKREQLEKEWHTDEESHYIELLYKETLTPKESGLLELLDWKAQSQHNPGMHAIFQESGRIWSGNVPEMVQQQHMQLRGKWSETPHPKTAHTHTQTPVKDTNQVERD